ncbi:SDR family NAD(P)-dependent oxidoreductase [Parahaliea mediterranea]|uniref:SDR family NAD(P)-dependent oxidoreductase n=1 Tax=Parahaliea mediterranea TaxID=651086 RepID=A0A939IL92_9GAMM|nr:SDR family NAD(P)-dependent oxidoreductase [Parahaliea mediterranea]MBN7795738.1 SDR family NAD(P)-dependent oxidoreductase [Parahaliea mediterranea]
MTNRKTALVTGASAGIGRQFAIRLAQLCDHVILVGRRKERLQALGEELHRAGVTSGSLAVDLASDAGIAAVVDAIQSEGPLSYLVNNAGFTLIGDFGSLPLAEQMEMVRVHIQATTALTHAALPAMRERDSGTIINVSSMVTFTPYRDVAVYGGTKSFVDNFTCGLALELVETNIKVQSLIPGFTRTELHNREAFMHYETPAVPDHLWMNAEDVVEESLAALNREAARVVAGQVNRSAAIAALRSQIDDLEAHHPL